MMEDGRMFVLLDMREEEEEFEKEHLWGAVHFPVARLRRATNRFPTDLHYFTKSEGSLCVLCGLTGPALDEAAYLLREAGIDQNRILLLAQDLEEFTERYPALSVRKGMGERAQ
ncbi:hypothetical protein KIPB_007321 [Kipferlia bialata]|uniref:Rhodanese domain-containing protein n=1 Tax=Kipferlia bialata TaxID=797122 RepID=A0A9K3CYK0_9EUKA|nr:hypothetical protein KIPB_007321 [Kipferlia bialata]|eukprot:g7321.t1